MARHTNMALKGKRRKTPTFRFADTCKRMLRSADEGRKDIDGDDET